MDMLEHSLNERIDVDFPCRVSGGAHWLLNRLDDRWFLSIFNNEGVDRSAAKGDFFLREADIMSTINFRREPQGLRIRKCWPTGGTVQRQTGNTYQCAVPAGGFVILEFCMK
jgi:hypothetical protein